MLFLLSILTASYFARLGVNAISHNFNIAAEANNLYGILEVFDGHLLYPPKEQVPFGIYLYPPLQAYLYAFLLKIFPLKTLYPQIVFLRSLGLLFYGFSVLYLYRLYKKIFNAKISYFLIALALSFSKFADYLTSTRNDILSLFWEMGAFYYFYDWVLENKRKSLTLFFLFCVASVWTRQTGIAVFAGAIIFLLFQKKWKVATLLLALFILAQVAFFGMLHFSTQGNIWLHILLSNLRGFRPLTEEFLNYSLYSFLLSYVLFAFLFFQGVKLAREKKFYLWVLTCSIFCSASVFMRAGGDVNYFLESIFFAVPLVAIALNSFHQKMTFKIALTIQGLMISAFCILKTHSALQIGFLPYEAVAEKIKSEYEPYGFVTGLYSQNLGIYLRGWAIHGPDVSNAGFVSKNSHPALWFFVDDLKEKFDSKKISALVSTHPDCIFHHKGLLFGWQKNYQKLERPHPWVCVYRSDKNSNKSKHPDVRKNTSDTELLAIPLK